MSDQSFELETINKMYLELSQFATAKSEKELRLEKQLHRMQGFFQKLYNMEKTGWGHSNEVNDDIKFWMRSNSELLKELNGETL